MSTARGSIVVDELVIPIRDIRLARGLFIIEAEALGPMPAVCTSRYVVIGQDGREVYRSSGLGTQLAWPDLPASQGISVTIEAAVSGGVSTPR